MFLTPLRRAIMKSRTENAGSTCAPRQTGERQCMNWQYVTKHKCLRYCGYSLAANGVAFFNDDAWFRLFKHVNCQKNRLHSEFHPCHAMKTQSHHHKADVLCMAARIQLKYVFFDDTISSVLYRALVMYGGTATVRKTNNLARLPANTFIYSYFYQPHNGCMLAETCWWLYLTNKSCVLTVSYCTSSFKDILLQSPSFEEFVTTRCLFHHTNQIHTVHLTHLYCVNDQRDAQFL